MTDIQPRLIGQPKIQHVQVWILGGSDLDSLGGRLRLQHARTTLGQRRRDETTNLRLVVDDENCINSRHGRHAELIANSPRSRARYPTCVSHWSVDSIVSRAPRNVTPSSRRAFALSTN